MISNVKLSYDVIIYPDDDEEESISFSFYPKRVGSQTIQFDLPYINSEGVPMYIGFHDEKCWFIDTNNQRGIFLDSPTEVSSTADDLSLIDEYDKEACIVIAKAIEVICREYFDFSICEDYPF